MSERHELPHDPRADDYHRMAREAMIEYLRDKTTRDERKSIIKEALHEWLEEKWAVAGKWSVAGIFATAVAVLAYVYLTQHGWAPPR